MRLENWQYEEIKRTVIETFEVYGIKSIPISAFEMALKMGIKVVPYSSLTKKKRKASMKISCDGYSVDEGIRWIIYYNDDIKNYQRINNTIMHEIGHFALGHTEDGDEEEKEAEAKFFAKYALAPPPLIHNMRCSINTETIMATFDISYQAAKIAYKYYLYWLNYGESDYTDYEERMLMLFDVA